LGHSLGSGPAVLLATRHKAAALVLFGAFTSIPDAAAERYLDLNRSSKHLSREYTPVFSN
jgi:hypothetical protein